MRKSKYEFLTSTFPFRIPSKVKIISLIFSNTTKGLKNYSLIPESTSHLSSQTEMKRAILRIHGLHGHLCSEVNDGVTLKKQSWEILVLKGVLSQGLVIFLSITDMEVSAALLYHESSSTLK